MSRNITEVSTGGRTYYICYSELDLDGRSDQLYWDTKPNSGMNKMDSKYILRGGEILDYFTNKRVSKYDLAEYFSSL